MKVLKKIKELEDLINNFKKKTSILIQQSILEDKYYHDLNETESQADKIVNDALLFDARNTDTLLFYNKSEFNFNFTKYKYFAVIVGDKTLAKPKFTVVGNPTRVLKYEPKGGMKYGLRIYNILFESGKDIELQDNPSVIVLEYPKVEHVDETKLIKIEQKINSMLGKNDLIYRMLDNLYDHY